MHLRASSCLQAIRMSCTAQLSSFRWNWRLSHKWWEFKFTNYTLDTDLLDDAFIHIHTVKSFLFAEQNPASCEGKCDVTEKCYLSNGVPVCESRRGLCWAWGGRHYQTFDGLIYDFEGTCTYLLAASKGAACGLTPFSVSKKDCSGITLHAYGFIIKLGSQKGRIHASTS